jgi:hypothetical protein
MDRRGLLEGLVGLTALRAAGGVAGHPTERPDGTPPSKTPSNPAGPLGSVTVEGATEAVVVDAQTVFVAATDQFVAADIADPASPTLLYESGDVLGEYADGPLTEIWDVAVDGEELLVVGPAHGDSADLAAAVLFDISDPAAPERTAVYEIDSALHNADLVDGLAYLTANGLDGKPLVIVDMGAGAERGRWALRDAETAWTEVPEQLRTLHDVTVADGVAYLAHWDAGTWLLDVADPADPTVLSSIRGRDPAILADVEDAGVEGRELSGNDHYALVNDAGTLLAVGAEAWASDADADTGPGGISLFDVTDPTLPREQAVIEAPPTPDPTRDGVWTTAHNFSFAGNYLYAAWYQGGVTVHDIADPAAPRELYHWRDADRAKFWTAHRAVPGESFIASSWEHPAEDGPGELFTFPDPVPATAATPTAQPVDGTAQTSGGTGAGAGPVTVLGGLAVATWQALAGSGDE